MANRRRKLAPEPTGSEDSSAASARSGVPFASLLAAAMLLVVVWLLFGRVVDFEFLTWDDPIHVTDNPYLYPVSWQGLWQFWRQPYRNVYEPLSYTFYAVEAWISRTMADRSNAPLRASVFHTGNLLIHAACALVVFGILRRWFASVWVGLAGALVFALHPLQVESVAWVSETRGMLAALFGLLAIGCYMRAAGLQRLVCGPSWRWVTIHDPAVRVRRNYMLATVALVAALLCKPSAAAVPLIVLILDAGLLDRRWPTIARWLAPWFAMVLVITVINTLQRVDTDMAYVPPVVARPLIALDAAAFYVGKFFWPYPLGFDYGRHPGWLLGSSYVYWTWIVVPALTVLLAWLPGRRLWLSAWGVFLAGLLPVLGFIPFEYQDFSTVADRYVYLAMFGPALAFAGLLATPRRWFRAMLVVLPVWGWLTLNQLETWRNDQTLCKHGVAVNPESTAALTNLGNYFMSRGEADRALPLFAAAVKLRDDWALMHMNVAAALLSLGGNLDRALDHAETAVSRNPQNAAAQATLAAIHARREENDKAIAAARKALELDPKNESARLALGTALWQKAEYQAAYDECPELARFHRTAARQFFDVGDYPEALYHSELAVEMLPKDAQSRMIFGLSLLRTRPNERERAAGHLLAAVNQEPELFEARINLARTLALLKDPKSVEHAQAAVKLRPRSFEAQLVLVAALLTTDDRKGAQAAFQRAMELAPDTPEARSNLRAYAKVLEDPGPLPAPPP